MPSGTRFGAMAMALALVLAATAPAVASEPADISVTTGDTTFTVTVTHNGTAVNDTTVNVTPKDPANVSYAGDTGVTDANGTVTFDLPDNETAVNVSTTVDGTTTTVMETLPAANGSDELVWDGSGPFGQWVVSWLHNLMPPDNDRIFGQTVSEIVTANNPGSEHRSDKANPGGNSTGPPDHAVNGSENAGNSSGPPDHAANKSESEGNTSNNGNGNAPDKGNGNDNLARAVEL